MDWMQSVILTRVCSRIQDDSLYFVPAKTIIICAITGAEFAPGAGPERRGRHGDRGRVSAP